MNIDTYLEVCNPEERKRIIEELKKNKYWEHFNIKYFPVEEMKTK